MNQYPLAVGGHRNHVHVFFELNPVSSLADIMEKLKANSSKWINDNKFVMGHFEWRGAMVDLVIRKANVMV
jgi:putative transposase